jgi:hypothetical protein
MAATFTGSVTPVLFQMTRTEPLAARYPISGGIIASNTSAAIGTKFARLVAFLRHGK